MLQAINTKLLIAILAALGTITALVIHERSASEHAAAEAAKAAREAQLLRQQESQRTAERDAAQKEWDEQRRIAEREQKHHNTNNSDKANAWKKDLP